MKKLIYFYVFKYSFLDGSFIFPQSFKPLITHQSELKELTESEIENKYQVVSPNQVQQVKKKLLEGTFEIFQSKTTELEERKSRILKTI